MAPPSALLGGRLTGNPLLDFASIIGGEVPTPIYVDFIANEGGDEGNASTYTWTGAVVGPGGIAKSLDRIIVVCEQADDNNTDEGDPALHVTVGGNRMVRWAGIHGQSSENENGIGIWLWEDTGLVTADVVCTYTDERVRANISVFNVGNVEHVAPHFVNANIDDSTANDNISASFQVAPNEKGLVVVGSINQDASPGISWTNATEVNDTGKGSTVLSCATIDTGDITDTGTVTATFSGAERMAMCGMVWRQANPAVPFTDLESQNIREINYIGFDGTGTNATSYTFSNAATGRIAGAGEQKTNLIISHNGDGGNQSADLFDTGHINIGGNPTQSIVVQNQVYRSTTNVTVSSCAALVHNSDTGTTSDIVIKTYSDTTLSRQGYSLYAIYHDSGTTIEVTGTNTMDSGGGSMMVQQTPGCYYIGACTTYDGTAPTLTPEVKLRASNDIEGGDYALNYDDGDDTGGNLRYFGGDTGSVQDNQGSPGGFRMIVFLNGQNNRNSHIAFGLR